MKQYETVIKVMEENGGYATLGLLYQEVLKIPGAKWKTKTPFASIRRIVQDNRFFFKIKPGLWALKKYKSKLPDNVLALMEEREVKGKKDFSHYYYQGIIVEIGNMRKFKTYVPPQDKNKPFLSKTLKDISTLDKIPRFTYDNIINRIKSIDVIWINERNFPDSVFEIEHTSDFKNSLIKFYELRNFYTQMKIVGPKERRAKFSVTINLNIFSGLKDRVKFLDYDGLIKYYSEFSKFKMVEKEGIF